MFAILGQLVVAYWLADLGAAVFHVVTDHGWNTRRYVAQFIGHHERPSTMTLDFEPLIVGFPITLLGLLFGNPVFWLALGLFVGFAQVPHYFAHHPAPALVRTLQRWGLMLHPAAHNMHHNGDFSRNFSVINGWSNGFLNWCLARAGL